MKRLATWIIVALLPACSAELLDSDTREYAKRKPVVSEAPAFAFASEIQLGDTVVSVDFAAVRQTLLAEANKAPGDHIGGPCGTDSWTLLAYRLPTFVKIFPHTNPYEIADDMVCNGDECSMSSAPPDLTDKGWQDMISEMIRRVAALGVDILSADGASIDPAKLATYLATPDA